MSPIVADDAYQPGDPIAARWSNSAVRAPSSACRCARTTAARRHHGLPPGGAAVHRQADRAVAEFRGAGGDRDGECAADRPRRARPWSSRPRPPRCCRSSTPRPATSRRCSTRCSKRRQRFAKRPRGNSPTYDGERFRAVAVRGVPAAYVEVCCAGPISADSGTSSPRLVLGERVVHIADVVGTELYRAGHDDPADSSTIGGARSLLSVALRKDDALLGAIDRLSPGGAAVLRQADRAVAEFRGAGGHRDGECAADDRDARGAWSSRPRPPRYCRSSIPRPATSRRCSTRSWKRRIRLCGAAHGSIATCRRRALPRRRGARLSGSLCEIGCGRPFRPVRALRYAATDRRRAVRPHRRYRRSIDRIRSAAARSRARRHSHTACSCRCARTTRCSASSPPIGQEVRPFSDKQIALLQNFAAQAVIAMENARLITETREALEQQTATAEVLQVINSSPGDLAPVFDAMLEKAMRLCEAAFGMLDIYDGEHFRLRSRCAGLPELSRTWIRRPSPIGRPARGVAERYCRGHVVSHPRRLRARGAYQPGDRGSASSWSRLRGTGASLRAAAEGRRRCSAPFIVYRQEVRPFTDKQIALLQNFAAQAVIAMENARLIDRDARGTGAADRDRRGIAGHQLLARRPRAGVRRDARKGACVCATPAFGSLLTYDGEQFQSRSPRG